MAKLHNSPMPFHPTRARHHAVHGLQFHDGERWWSEDTKVVLLDAGIVLLSDAGTDDSIPFPVSVPGGLISVDPITINGTRDSQALELACRRSRQELPYTLDGSWTEIELPED